MKKIYLVFLALILTATISCEKNESVNLNPNVSSSNDILLTGTEIQNVFVLLMKARCNQGVMCGQVVSIDSTIVSYDSACRKFSFIYTYALGPDSVRRSGSVSVKSNGDLFSAGTTTTVSFEDYREDLNVFRCSDSITTVQNGTQCSFRIRVRNGELIKVNNNGTSYFTSSYNAVVSDDPSNPGSKRVSFTGTLDGTSSKGNIFTSVITEEIVWLKNCPWAVNGMINVNVPSGTVTEGTIRCNAPETCNNVFYYDINDMVIKVRKLNRYLL